MVSSFDDFQAKIKTTCASDSELAEVQDYTQRVQRAIELQAQKQYSALGLSGFYDVE